MTIAIKSPCVKNCCLDEDDICLGCFRHVEEIMAWQGSSLEKRQAILQRSEQRKKRAKHFF